MKQESEGCWGMADQTLKGWFSFSNSFLCSFGVEEKIKDKKDVGGKCGK